MRPASAPDMQRCFLHDSRSILINLLVPLVTLLSDCSPGRNDTVQAPRDELVRFAADLFVLREEINFSHRDTTWAVAAEESLYAAHALTPAAVSAEMDRMGRNPETWHTFFERVHSRIEAMRRDSTR